HPRNGRWPLGWRRNAAWIVAVVLPTDFTAWMKPGLGMGSASPRVVSDVLRGKPGPDDNERNEPGKKCGKPDRHVIGADMDQGMGTAGCHENPGQRDLHAVELAGRQHERTDNVEEDREFQEI